MLIERIELRLLALPLVEPFVAAHGTTSNREIVVVRIDTDRGHGWGECSALPEPTYTDEFAAGAFIVLDEELAPRLVGHRLDAAAVRSRLAVVGENPMAAAALEMALLDVELRMQRQPLAVRLGATTTAVPAGAAIGLGAPGEVAERAAALVAEGFERVKLKITPGHDLALVEAVRAAAPSAEIHLDGNGSYRPAEEGILGELAQSGIGAIEQPFAPTEVDAAARLVADSPVPIVADEAASSVAAIDRLRRAGALSGVSLKPPRLGGILAAVEAHDRCRSWGLAMTAGGMVETGLGRHALAAVAALGGFTLTGDVSPAGRWLRADPWSDVTMQAGKIDVPDGPGIAPDPDPDLLDEYTTRRAELHR